MAGADGLAHAAHTAAPRTNKYQREPFTADPPTGKAAGPLVPEDTAPERRSVPAKLNQLWSTHLWDARL